VSSLKKVELKDVAAYDAPGHFKMVAMRLHGKEETNCQSFWMGMSHFLPGGGAQYDDSSPCDKVYFVLEGEITVISKTEEVTIGKWDSLFIGPNEGREIINNTNKPATMLVVYNYPK
jgi:mannose-6-phosphate isomerase-like protein (cupin superfamily)